MQSADECFTRRAACALSRNLPPVIKQLVQERRSAGIKLGDLAERAGYTESMFTKMECGERTPGLATLHDWAEALGLELALKKRSET